MRFVPFGTHAALLLWQPGRGDAGTQLVRLEGATRAGLVTRETLEIRVDATRGR